MEKIIQIGKDKLDEYDLKEMKGLDFDTFIYSYEQGNYDGSGFAAWKKGDKWFYHEMGHCSCHGPLENIVKSAGVGCTFEQLKEIAEKNYESYGKEVIKYIEENNL